MLHHFRSVVESTGVPVMLYDVPGRTATQIDLDTYAAAKEWDTVVAVKDAVGDYARGVKIIQHGLRPVLRRRRGHSGGWRMVRRGSSRSSATLRAARSPA